ncbi:hypothetical protein F2Q69_00037460 [Brassica cretica]|uniref:Uncharacterized protein n=1 Tax=Brassica cretica TaxID=69181 RepID=A0A8S9SKE3_BRACR|nr:hypothetical protein F2Q69_00037460 [Brassica cretica]
MLAKVQISKLVSSSLPRRIGFSGSSLRVLGGGNAERNGSYFLEKALCKMLVEMNGMGEAKLKIECLVSDDDQFPRI